ncbi:hypothetical protein Tsubulata_028969 [Turnera subulata]|uniref:Protein kinase domain-containing protein n=1 Tax=Turnera subulata TaxID=218843 RepID=A0A9Q0IZ91_9ROSI|nr:hypothetical protein Tsubulata_028969 [Turnera subulata]
MPVEQETKVVEKRNVLVGIRIDSHSRELLNWAIVKVAEPGDCVIAVHVCASSGHASKVKLLLENYLEGYDVLCSMKKVGLSGQVSKGISVHRTLVREAKNYAAVAIVVGTSNQSAPRGWSSIARYCAKKLPSTTDVLAINNGKMVFRRCNNSQLTGLSLDPKPSFCPIENPTTKDFQSEFDASEADTDISSFDVLAVDESEEAKDEVSSLGFNKRSSVSHFSGDILDQRPGWPLLRRPVLATADSLQQRKVSVVQWAMNLPNRFPYQSPRVSTENPSEIGRSDISEESNSTSSFSLSELETGFDVLLKAKSSHCKWFSYEVLETATTNFCAENLIGKGGCNRVYKGILPDGKPVAVKIQKSSQEALKDFAHEIGIISSLNHRHIAPLVGFCIEHAYLISVYDFFSKGSLEENLHGNNKDKSSLSWAVRFDIAVKIGEALNHLHNECSQPVIHRDVKSSNILLSDGFEPKLSDFGLAIWGPTTSSFITQGDVVGTFGYLAPEYFMYGKVSNKIDVYAFGVVLLELLSGRRPIATENPKGQESLVMWAKPMIENGNTRGILDPELDENLDVVQMQRMVLAATLCITRSARLRPKMSEILKLLRGDKDVHEWVNPENEDMEDPENPGGNDDEVYPNYSADLHLSLALLDVDDDSTSFSSSEQGNSLSLEEYLKGRWSRSSSFN